MKLQYSKITCDSLWLFGTKDAWNLLDWVGSLVDFGAAPTLHGLARPIWSYCSSASRCVCCCSPMPVLHVTPYTEKNDGKGWEIIARLLLGRLKQALGTLGTLCFFDMPRWFFFCGIHVPGCKCKCGHRAADEQGPRAPCCPQVLRIFHWPCDHLPAFRGSLCQFSGLTLNILELLFRFAVFVRLCPTCVPYIIHVQSQSRSRFKQPQTHLSSYLFCKFNQHHFLVHALALCLFILVSREVEQ